MKSWRPKKPNIIRVRADAIDRFGNLRIRGGTFPFPFVPPKISDATITHTATVNDGSDQTTYSGGSFSGVAIGTAAANRTILVGVAHQAAFSLSTLTVGGISAAAVVTLGGANRNCAIWQADVPTGTTADFVITFGGAVQDCGIDVWAAYGIGATSDTQTSTANPMSATLSIPAGGVAVGIATNFAGSPTFTWSELTENSDQIIPASGNIAYTGASRASATAVSPTVTCTPSVASNERMVLASFAAG